MAINSGSRRGGPRTKTGGYQPTVRRIEEGYQPSAKGTPPKASTPTPPRGGTGATSVPTGGKSGSK